MSLPILSRSAFSTPTTTLARETVGSAVQTETNPAPCPVVEIDLYRTRSEDLPAGHVAIEDFIAESEKHSDRKAALEAGRQWILETFYRGDESIRALRLRTGISQAKLAILAGTTQSHIARIELGVTDCQVGTLERVARALKLDPLIVVKAFLITRGQGPLVNTK